MNSVRCFGVAKEIVGDQRLKMEIEGLSISEFKTLIQQKFPEFATIKGYMVAVNQVYALDSQVLSNNDEVAIIPPVSGG